MKIHVAILAILGWFALLAQLYLNITGKAAPIPEILIRYVSYFTITTNLIVAVCCTTLLSGSSRWHDFVSRPKTLTAVAVYILVVGIIYNIILRFLWNPQGLQRVVDEILHSAVPALFVVYWFLFVSKNSLKWKDVLPWLTYPLGYTMFVLIRGSVSGFYPYPFINISKLGLKKVLINGFGIAVLFLVLSLLFVGVGKMMRKKALH